LLDDDGAGCEALAALLSCGSISFVRTVDGDQWEETLEEQAVWQSQRRRRQHELGSCPEAGGGLRQEAAEEGGRRQAGARPAAQHQALRQRVSSAWDEASALLPLGAPLGVAAAAAVPAGGLPLAEGRRIKGMAWVGPGRLLLVAAPHPEAEFEGGQGDVLVEVAVKLPEPLMSAREGEGVDLGQGQGGVAAPELEEVAVSYSGGSVLCAASLPPPSALAGQGRELCANNAGGGDGGGVLLQLASGALMRWDAGASAPAPLAAGASFPVPCAPMAALPPGGIGAAAAVGLAAGGALYYGSRLVAGGVTSFAIRCAEPQGRTIHLDLCAVTQAQQTAPITAPAGTVAQHTKLVLRRTDNGLVH
jgi:hypothetical protein